MDDVLQLFKAVEFSKWYNAIQEHTFASIECPTTVEECQALLKLNRATIRRNQAQEQPTSAGLDLTLLSSEAEREALKALASRLDTLLQEQGSTIFRGTHSAFAKMGDRSAKDAASAWVRVSQLYEERVRSEREKGNTASNMHLQSLVWANANAQRVSSGLEILGLFAASERVSDELELKLEFTFPPQPVPVLLREWVQDFDPAFEFRAFVVHDQLTAMSQMSSMEVYLHYPQVLERRQELAASAKQFFERELQQSLAPVTAATESGRYVVDLYYDVSRDQWRVVELNPYETSAMGHLFNFARDEAQLARGPFELRLREVTRQEDVNAISNDHWKRALQESSDVYH